MQTNLLLFGSFRNVFITHSYANDLYALYNYPVSSVSFDLPRRVLYNRPKANTLARFRESMKTCESVKRNVELFFCNF